MPENIAWTEMWQYENERRLFLAWLARFKDVRPAFGTVDVFVSDVRPGMQLADLLPNVRLLEFTARCPVNADHRVSIKMVVGGALTTCERCSASAGGNARFGRALARLSGVAAA